MTYILFIVFLIVGAVGVVGAVGSTDPQEKYIAASFVILSFAAALWLAVR